MTQVLGIQIINAKASGVKLLSNDLASDEHINIYRVGDKTALTPVNEATIDKIASFAEQLGVEDTLLTFVGINTETGDFDEDFAKPYVAQMKEKFDLKTSALTLNDVDDLADLVESFEKHETKPVAESQTADETSTEPAESDVALDDIDSDFGATESEATEDVVIPDSFKENPETTEAEAPTSTEETTDVEPEAPVAETSEDELTPYQQMAIEAIQNANIKQFDVDISDDTLSVLPEITELRKSVNNSLSTLIEDLATAYEKAEAQARENADDATLNQARLTHEQKIAEIKGNQTPMETQALRDLDVQRDNAREAYVAEHIDDLRRQFDEETKDEFAQKRDEAIGEVRDKISKAVEVENQAFDDFRENKVEPLIIEERESVDAQPYFDAYNATVDEAEQKLNDRQQELAQAHQAKINADNAEIVALKSEIENLRHTNDLMKKNIDIHIDSKLESERLEFNSKMNESEEEIARLREQNSRLSDNNRLLTSDLRAFERWGGVKPAEATAKKA